MFQAEAEQLIARGRAALLAGDGAQADQLLEQASRRYEVLGDHYSIAAQTGNYGWALRRAGRPDEARPYLRRAAELFTRLGMADFAERHRLAAEDGEPLFLSADLLATLPPAVRGALERGDRSALQFALDALPLAERQLVFDRLAEAGVISAAEAPDAEELVLQFSPLLEGIVAAARGDNDERREVEAALAELERRGWMLTGPVHAIWGGERDVALLTRNLDETDALLIRRLLDLLEH